MTDFYSYASSDKLCVYRSKVINTPEAGTLNLIQIPRKALILDVKLEVRTAGSTETVSVGWMGNGETAQTAGFLSTGIAAVMDTGMKTMFSDTGVSSSGKYFGTSRGAITLTTGTTQTTGQFVVFCVYSVIR